MHLLSAYPSDIAARRLARRRGEFWLSWWATGYQTQAEAEAASAQHTQIQAAVDAVLNYCASGRSARLLCPPLFYKLGGSVQFARAAISLCSYEVIGGVGGGLTNFLVNYDRTSANDAAIDVGDGTNSQMRHSFSGIQIAAIGTFATRKDPILFSVRRGAQSRYDLSFGSCNSMNARFVDCQNIDGEIFSTSGGRVFWHKNTGDLLVRQSDGAGGSGSQINKQSGTATFGATDTGMHAMITDNPVSSVFRHVKLTNSSATRNDAVTPVLGSSSQLDSADRKFFFETAQVTTTSGSANFTISGDGCLDSTFVNQPVCVAFDAAASNGRIWFTSIASVTGATTGTFADTAPMSTSASIIARIVTPGVSFYNSALIGSSSDIRFKLRLANAAGVTLALRDINTGCFNDSKLTSLTGSSLTYDRFTQSNIWADQAVGMYSGEIQDQTVGERIFAAGLTSPFVIYNTRIRIAEDGLAARIAGKSSSNEGGVLVLSNVAFAGTASGRETPEYLLYDPHNSATDPGYLLSGLWIIAEHNVNRFYANNKVYTDVSGNIAGGLSMVLEGSSSGAILRVTQTGSGNALLVEDSANPDSTPVVIDASGRVVVGDTTARTYGGAIAAFQQAGLTAASVQAALASWVTSTGTGPRYIFSRSRGGTIGTHSAVVDGNLLGEIQFEGSDGTAFIPGVSIKAEVDGTPGTNDMPSRLVFGTTLDGAAAITSRWQIGNAGMLRALSGSFSRAAPVTKTGDFTVATSENWLINNKAGSACVVTLPSASAFPGREIMIQNYQAQTVDSNASNVVPLGGGAAGTAILSGTAGRWCTLVSDATNWVIMAGVI